MSILGKLMATAFLVVSQMCTLLFKSRHQIYALLRPLVRGKIKLFPVKVYLYLNPAPAFISSPNSVMGKGDFSLLKAYSYIYVSGHCGI